MNSRLTILLLLPLMLGYLGCVTDTRQTRFDATAVVQATDVQEFGLLSSPATEANAGPPNPRDRSLTDNPSAQATTILSVGYTEDDQAPSSGESKIDSSTSEDAGLHSESQTLAPSALPLESDFAPTVWTGITIDQVRQMAYENHPVTARAQARLDALRGRHLQKGLPNNPRVGVNADEVNDDGGAGRWGVQFGRQIVRRDKRQSDQAIVCAEIEVATEELRLAQQRLDTDITIRFYDCIVAQEQLAMSQRMQGLARRSTELSRNLFAGQEVARSAVLQSELELEKANVTLRRLENRHLWAKRQLAALVGQEELPTANVGGSIDDLSLEEDFESTYDRLLKHSPELSVLFADIERSRRVASRQRLETRSDITWQTTVQYDTTQNNAIGGFQVTWQIPTLNQNQGAIYEAERNIAAGQHAAEIKALDIRQRLANQWQQYLDAKLQVDAFRDSILPKSQQTLEILMKGYEAGELELLEVLTAQRTFFQTQVAYLENVRSLSRQNAAIDGMLLSDSLSGKGL